MVLMAVCVPAGALAAGPVDAMISPSIHCRSTVVPVRVGVASAAMHAPLCVPDTGRVDVVQVLVPGATYPARSGMSLPTTNSTPPSRTPTGPGSPQ